MKKRFVRKEGGEEGTEFVDVDGERWPKGTIREDDGDEESKEEKYELGEVRAGTLVLIHGNLLHKSERNLSENSRFIYTFHVIEGDAEYDDKNWLQPPAKGFTRLFEYQ